MEGIWLFVKIPVIQQHCGLCESGGDVKGCLFESLVSLSSPHRLKSSETCFLSSRNKIFPAQPGSCTLLTSLPWIWRRLHIRVGVRFKYEFSDRGVNFLRYDLHMWKYGYLFSCKISYCCWWLGREICPSPVPSTCSYTWFRLRNESLSEGDIHRAIDCSKNK